MATLSAGIFIRVRRIKGRLKINKLTNKSLRPLTNMNLIKLIEAVRKQPGIYRSTHVNEEEYEKEWQKVAKNLDVSTNTVQDKWNEVLETYMEYLRGNQDFGLAKYMDFLQPYLFNVIDEYALDEEELKTILNGEKHDTDGDEETIHDDNCNDEEKHDNEIPDEEENVIDSKSRAKFEVDNKQNDKRASAVDADKPSEDVPNIKQERVLNSPQNTVSDSDNLQNNNTESSPDPMAKQNIVSTPVALQNMKQTQEPTPPVQNESHLSGSYYNNLSSLELIFLGYAKQLQKMPRVLQLKSKRKIADIMDEAELEMLEM